MTHDMKTVRDHPAKIVEWAVSDTRSVGMTTAVEWHEAATHLRNYETDHNVTFAALDNDALERVREAYAMNDTPSGVGHTREEWMEEKEAMDVARLVELEAAVRDLLGLD